MDQQAKVKWVEALRSGKYKQTTGNLKTSKEGECFYCCLGVLCEVMGVEEEQSLIVANVFGEQGRIMYHSFKQNEFFNSGTLDEGSFGLSKSEISILTDMNDMMNRSFNEIADYIEENL